MQNDTASIIDVLPLDVLKETIRMLPASHLFLSPVCKTFRDCYTTVVDDTKQGKTYKYSRGKTYKYSRGKTYKYSIHSEDALRIILEDKSNLWNQWGSDRRLNRNQLISTIGAGCGRKDWVERGGVFDESTCSAAAKGGRLPLLQWLRRRGCPWDEKTCSSAAQHGHLELLQWARGEGCPWNSKTCFLAARHGHFELLQWARGKGCEWESEHNESMCVEAASGGYLEMLQWVRREGCEWDEDTFMWAARGGKLEVLQWMREEGCEWSFKTCLIAADYGRIETLKWAIENGCEYRDFDLQCVKDPVFVEWFERHEGFDVRESLYGIRSGLGSLEWVALDQPENKNLLEP